MISRNFDKNRASSAEKTKSSSNSSSQSKFKKKPSITDAAIGMPRLSTEDYVSSAKILGKQNAELVKAHKKPYYLDFAMKRLEQYNRSSPFPKSELEMAKRRKDMMADPTLIVRALLVYADNTSSKFHTEALEVLNRMKIFADSFKLDHGVSAIFASSNENNDEEIIDEKEESAVSQDSEIKEDDETNVDMENIPFEDFTTAAVEATPISIGSSVVTPQPTNYVSSIHVVPLPALDENLTPSPEPLVGTSLALAYDNEGKRNESEQKVSSQALLDSSHVVVPTFPLFELSYSNSSFVQQVQNLAAMKVLQKREEGQLPLKFLNLTQVYDWKLDAQFKWINNSFRIETTY